MNLNDDFQLNDKPIYLKNLLPIKQYKSNFISNLTNESNDSNDNNIIYSIDIEQLKLIFNLDLIIIVILEFILI
jgi:hypothetical protein